MSVHSAILSMGLDICDAFTQRDMTEDIKCIFFNQVNFKCKKHD